MLTTIKKTKGTIKRKTMAQKRTIEDADLKKLAMQQRVVKKKHG